MTKTQKFATHLASALSLLAPLANAAPAMDPAGIEAQYQRDRSACLWQRTEVSL